MKKALIAAILISIVLITGCSKSSPSLPPTFTSGYNVYMAGTAAGKAVYWKNGVEVDLAQGGTAYSIAISGSDIYVGGFIYDGNNIEAAYWKNGQQIQLEGPGVSHVFGIGINGTDVYCVGDLFGPSGSGWDSTTYWKNGVRMHLSPNAKGKATNILFAGTEIYISGQVWDSFDSGIVWKNGVQNWYSIPGSINAMALTPTDTVVVGNVGSMPAYWTHSSYHPLSKNGYGTSVAISGSDIYIGGDTLNSDGVNQAVFWKNDAITPLKSTYSYSSVLGIALAGTDIYAAGDVYDKTTGKYLPVYWKNGTMNKLSDDGEVYAITAGSE